MTFRFDDLMDSAAPVFEQMLRQAARQMQQSIKERGHSGRASLWDGPCAGACVCLCLHGRDVSDLPELHFRPIGGILVAQPADEGHLYRQRRDSQGRPVVNLAGNIIYDWVPDEQTH